MEFVTSFFSSGGRSVFLRLQSSSVLCRAPKLRVRYHHYCSLPFLMYRNYGSYRINGSYYNSGSYRISGSYSNNGSYRICGIYRNNGRTTSDKVNTICYDYH